MITIDGLTKRFGDWVAVDDLSTTIRPGVVTGFLGPNGAGKSTTMRMIVGLDRPTAGSVTIDGRPYAALPSPTRTVGALLDAATAHPGRRAHDHLRMVAASNGISRRRVATVLDQVGLGDVGNRRTGGFSLGMAQRLGIATALLGDPEILLLDEPVNGLDPDGVRWIREFIRSLAAEGRTVLVSSHLMSEMQHTADHLIVIGRGRLIADAPLQDVLQAASLNAVRVRTPQPETFAAELVGAGCTVQRASTDELVITGASLPEIGDLAHRTGIRLHELTTKAATLEEAYLELTGAAVEYTDGAADTTRASGRRPRRKARR
ncbi:ABC transporter ATP-binding protein [Microlunatus soli]|uniref:ABC-2 type transport system ATP-binding protein n=1 Tax=Microlunatus soli TaxID=630515 RepID=A0A1H1SVE3_9ACTN|nr:ATP-binding cassette domain-containing protein [Microlunatus soli]SDS51818.1 ABC-2 type transport system ATP-binding protein [Microlunatus soli]